MGTSFFWDVDLPPSRAVQLPTGEEVQVFARVGADLHIGKRSAAGLYCYDCKRTLCKEGESGIHQSYGTMLKACPDCGGTLPKESDLKTPGCAVGIELGFARPREERARGVAGASSFSWAMEPNIVKRACENYMEAVVVRDEYDRKYTGGEFLRMINLQCPIVFLDHVGKCFS